MVTGAPGVVDPTLEGFLWPATYRVLPDTSAEELIRLMLDKFIAQVGEERLQVAKDRGMTFYEILTLASIVEREAVLPEEKPLIAGVYQNRINGIKGVKNRLLNADPTVIYAADTVALSETPLEEWLNYLFWKVPETPMKDIALPENLQGFQTYQVPGLVPWPIATPSLGSIAAALAPIVAVVAATVLAVFAAVVAALGFSGQRGGCGQHQPQHGGLGEAVHGRLSSAGGNGLPPLILWPSSAGGDELILNAVVRFAVVRGGRSAHLKFSCSGAPNAASDRTLVLAHAQRLEDLHRPGGDGPAL